MRCAGAMEVGLVKIGELKLGDAAIKDKLFAVIPLDPLSAVQGYSMLGMVGFESFRRFVTRIDYGSNALTLMDPKAFDPRMPGRRRPCSLRQRGSGDG
jgi:hypothetical protein